MYEEDREGERVDGVYVYYPEEARTQRYLTKQQVYSRQPTPQTHKAATISRSFAS